MDLMLYYSDPTFVGEITCYLLTLVKDIDAALWFLAFGTFLFVLVFLLAVTFIYRKLRSKPLPLFFNTEFNHLVISLALIILIYAPAMIVSVWYYGPIFVGDDPYHSVKLLKALWALCSGPISALYGISWTVFKGVMGICIITYMLYAKLFLKSFEKDFGLYFSSVAFSLVCLMIIFSIIYFLVWPFMAPYFSPFMGC